MSIANEIEFELMDDILKKEKTSKSKVHHAIADSILIFMFFNCLFKIYTFFGVSEC